MLTTRHLNYKSNNMEANQILTASLLDVIFDDRNKSYGAYELRKTYDRRVMKAMGITFTIALVCIVTSVIAGKFKASVGHRDEHTVIVVRSIPPDEATPVPPLPPPPKAVAPPQQALVRFTTFKLVDQTDVEPPPTQQDLGDAHIDIITQTGTPDDHTAVIDDIDDGKGVFQAKVVEDEDKIFVKVEAEASFLGGAAGWIRFLERNLDAVGVAGNGAPAGLYKVIVRFVVAKDGSISDVEPVTHFGYGMEEEAMRVIKKGPKWKPAMQNGTFVKSYKSQPITFDIQGE